MDFQARVIQVLPEVTGTSKAGNPWKKKEWIVETFGQYPRKVKVQCFGDRADTLILEEGQDYNLFVDLESREFNGRWYTDVSVFRVEKIGAQGGTPNPGTSMSGGFNQSMQEPPFNPGPYGGQGMGHTPNFTASEDAGEDLPF